MQLTVNSGQLPVGWEVKKLGEVTTIVNGGTPKSEQSEYWNGDIFWITPRDMGKLKSIYVSNTSRKISQAGLQKSSAKLIPENSVILSTRAPIGHIAINKVAMATNQGCRGLVPKLDIDTKFLFYFLKLNIQLLNELGTGTTFKELSTNSLAGVKIPIPLLPEQKRIVAILDEAFEGMDKAIANTKKNLTNSRELFESYLNAVFTQKGDGWEEKKLEKLASKIGSGATPRGGQDSYKIEGISLIRSLNVYDRRFKTKDLAFIDDEQAEKLANVVVEEGDVLINITGASIARSCVAPSEYLPARVNQHVSIIRPDPNQISCRFLNYLITSKPYKDRLLFTGDKAGATRQALTKAQIQDFSVHFPSLDEQELIVRKLDLLEAETQRLETIYRQKLAALNELKQSILQKAFTGELTADTANQVRKTAKEEIAA